MAEPTRIPDPRTSVVDIPRKKPPTRGRNIAIAVGGLAAVAAITFMLSRLRSAAPVVDRSSLWTDTVKRGPMLREVKGPGTLVPEQIRLITADTAGRVERIPLRPGARVDPGTILMELSNPDVMLQALPLVLAKVPDAVAVRRAVDPRDEEHVAELRSRRHVARTRRRGCGRGARERRCGRTRRARRRRAAGGDRRSGRVSRGSMHLAVHALQLIEL